MELEGLWLKIGAKFDGLDKAFSDIGTMMRLQIAGAAMEVGRTLTDSLTRPLLDVGLAALKLGSDFEQSKIAFTTMLGSAERATAFLADLKAFAAGTPFEFPGLVDAARRLQALGFASDQVIPSLRAIGDAAAALGGGAQMIDRVTLALGQMQSKGKVSAQEMNQLAESGINAWKILADGMGKTIPEVMKLAEKGMINAARAVPEILDGLNKQFGGMMEKQAQTIAGQWSNIKDQITFILMDLGEALAPAAQMAMDALKPLLGVAKLAVEAFKEMDPGMQLAIIAFAALAAAAGPVLAAVGAMAAGFTAISGAVAVLTGPAMLAGVVIALKAVAIGAAAVAAAWGAWKLGEWLVSLGPVREALDAIKKKLGEFWDWFSKLPGVSTALKALGDGWNDLKKGVGDAVDSVRRAGETFTPMGPTLDQLGVKVRKNREDWLNHGGGMDAAAEKAKKAAAAIQQAFSALSLKNLEKEYLDAQHALDLLTKKGLLSSQQLAEGADAVRKKYVAWQDSMRNIGDAMAASASMGFKSLNDLITKHAEWVMQGVKQRLVNAEFEKTSAELLKIEAGLAKSNIYLDPFVGNFLKAGEAMRQAAADAKTLGIVTGEELAGKARAAEEAYARMSQRADGSMRSQIDLQQALIKSLDAQIAAAKAAGEPWRDLEKRLDTAKEALGRMTGESVKSSDAMTKAWGEFGQQVSTILTDFGKGIADSILHAKSFGDAFTQMANALKEAFLRTVVEGAIKEAIKGLDGFTASFSGLMSKMTSGLGSLFGGGAAGGGAGAGGGASGGASGGLGGAAGALGGITGMIGSIGSLISGVIGNFQMSGMNKTLDLIEKEVRYSQIHLANLLEFANAWWPTFENLAQLQRLESIERVLYEQKAILDAGLRVNSQGLGDAQQTTINWLKHIAEGVWATYQAIAKPGWQTTPGGPVRFTNPSVPTSGGGDPTGSRPPVTIQVNVTGNSSNPYTQGLQVAQGINALLPARI